MLHHHTFQNTGASPHPHPPQKGNFVTKKMMYKIEIFIKNSYITYIGVYTLLFSVTPLHKLQSGFFPNLEFLNTVVISILEYSVILMNFNKIQKLIDK